MNIFPEWIDALAGWVWTTSVHASVLVLLVLALQSATRRWLAPRWHYALWWLVALRLLMPVSPSSSWSLFNLFPEPSPSRPQAPTGSSPGDISQDTVPGLIAHPIPTALRHIQNPIPAHRSLHNVNPTWAQTLWMTGVLAVLALAIGQHLRLASRIRRSRPVSDPSLLAQVTRCQEELGMSGALRLYELAGWHSPAVFGFRRPCLLLPQGLAARLNPGEFRLILLHELLHIQRGDLIVNGLLAFLQAVHWFNPLVWLAFKRLRAERELVCDAAVLRRLPAGERTGYGQTLIKLAQECSHRPAGPLMVPILNRGTELKRRVTLIATFKPGRASAAAAGTAAWILLAGATLTTASRNPTDGVPSKPAPAPSTAERSPASGQDKLRRLEAEEAVLRDRVRQGQRELDALRAELGLSSAGPEAQEVFPASDVDLSVHLELARESARAESERWRQMQRQLESLSRAELRTRASILDQDGLWTALLQRRAEAERQLDRFGPDHAETRAAQRVLTELDAQLDERAAGVLAGMNARAAASQAEVEALGRMQDENKAMSLQHEVRRRAYDDARRKLDHLQSTLEVLQIRRVQETLDLQLQTP